MRKRYATLHCLTSQNDKLPLAQAGKLLIRTSTLTAGERTTSLFVCTQLSYNAEREKTNKDSTHTAAIKSRTVFHLN